MSCTNMIPPFPYLLPVRRLQRKICFYTKMHFDKNHYAMCKEGSLLPIKVFEAGPITAGRDHTSSPQLIADKLHNLKLAVEALNKLVIRPNETFSFWQLVRHAGLSHTITEGFPQKHGNIDSDYGDGLCQLSSLLFWLFLHSPLTVIERHPHSLMECFEGELSIPAGMDAAVCEGWLDLKVKNETGYSYQLLLSVDEDQLYGSILSDKWTVFVYEVYHQDMVYFKKGDYVYRRLTAFRNKINTNTGKMTKHYLFDNICRIGYELPIDTTIMNIGGLL